MNSLLNRTIKQALFYSLLGMVFVLSSVLIVFPGSYAPENNRLLFSTLPVLDFLIRHMAFWKIFTWSAFIFGLSAYFNKSHKANTPYAALNLLLPLLTVCILAIFYPLFLAIIPLVILYYLLLFVKEIQSLHLFLLGSITALLAILSAALYGIPNLQEPVFYMLMNRETPTHIGNEIKFLASNPAIIFFWLYGFAVIFLGYGIAKKQWFLNYPFFYNELKRLFKLCLGLIIFWLTLNFFDAYRLITKWHFGPVFYLVDAMAVQLISVYVFIFILIYLENFKLGKCILKQLGYIGKNWPLNTIITTVAFFMAKADSKAKFMVFFMWITLVWSASFLTQKLTEKFSKESF